MYTPDIICPECGSPNIDIYEDGTCICTDCGFVFTIEYRV